MKRISIVIVTWNCKKYVKECLDSLESYRRDPQSEIIVVDNASQDGTPECVRKLYPEVLLIQSDENLGFAKGTNVGIRASSGKYVFLINPDVRVLDGCIEKMLDYIERNPRVGLLGPQMLGPDGGSERSYMGAPTLWRLFCRALALDDMFPRSKAFSGYLMSYFDRKSITDVDVLNGWFWLTRREALDEVGLLDESLFIYGDDLDWSKRFHRGGWKVVYFPEAQSLHYGGASTARAPIRFAVEMQRANFQYWKKYYGLASQMAYLVIMATHHLTRLVGYAILLLLPRSNREGIVFKVKKNLACLKLIFEQRHDARARARAKIQAEAGLQ